MDFLALIGVFLGLAAAAYRCTPHRKPSCGLDQSQKSAFLNRTLSCLLKKKKGNGTIPSGGGRALA
jgi:hypothetical protein